MMKSKCFLFLLAGIVTGCFPVPERSHVFLNPPLECETSIDDDVISMGNIYLSRAHDSWQVVKKSTQIEIVADDGDKNRFIIIVEDGLPDRSKSYPIVPFDDLRAGFAAIRYIDTYYHLQYTVGNGEVYIMRVNDQWSINICEAYIDDDNTNWGALSARIILR